MKRLFSGTTFFSGMTLLAAATMMMITGGCCMAKTEADNPQSPGTVRVMTCNLRGALIEDGQDSWGMRRPICLEALRKENADIYCFQEMQSPNRDAIEEAFPDYRFFAALDCPLIIRGRRSCGLFIVSFSGSLSGGFCRWSGTLLSSIRRRSLSRLGGCGIVFRNAFISGRRAGARFFDRLDLSRRFLSRRICRRAAGSVNGWGILGRIRRQSFFGFVDCRSGICVGSSLRRGGIV